MIYVLGFVPPCRVLNSSILKHFPRRKPLVIFFFFLVCRSICVSSPLNLSCPDPPSPVHQSFFMGQSLVWSVLQSLVCSFDSLFIRFCKQVIVAGVFLFDELLDFLISFVKPVLVFSGRQANNFSHGFLLCGLHLHPLFFRLCSCHTMKSFLQLDLQIVFHPWVRMCMHLRFLRLWTFPLRRRLEGKGDFEAYDQCSSLHSALLWYVVRLSCHSAELGRSPGGASV